MKNSWKIKNNQLLSAIVFLNGAVIMSIEIIGARTITPYFGTSIYVWTAVIGVILGALSLGYWQGGIIADKSASMFGLSKIFVVATLILALTTTLQTPVLNFISDSFPSLRLQAGLASLVLFAPTTFFLGTVSPYVAKLALTKLQQTGEIIGKLYALGTFGSIAGTFMTGYYLINYVGIRQLYWLFTVSILILAIICYVSSGKKISTKHSALTILLGALFLSLSSNNITSQAIVFAKDTAYASYKVEERTYNGKPTRLLITDNNGAQSGIFINEQFTPAFAYINSLSQVVENKVEKPEKILMIGGGTYTLPTILNNRYPNIKIDVVEIDPELDKIAVEYFNYKPSKNINIIHEDGRTFLNKSSNKYDLIILDAYNSLRPPFHLMTSEAVVDMKKLLNRDGLIASNVIGSSSGERSEFASSIEKTMLANFTTVSTFYTAKKPANQAQNLLYLASESGDKIKEVSYSFEEVKISDFGTVLTDNFAPTERMLGDF